MQGSAGSRQSAMLLLAAATLGCASASRRSAALATVCYPQQCFLDVQNDNGMSVGVRYYDSTGVGDVLVHASQPGERTCEFSETVLRSPRGFGDRVGYGVGVDFNPQVLVMYAVIACEALVTAGVPSVENAVPSWANEVTPWIWLFIWSYAVRSVWN